MLSTEDNELLCRVGPGTPMGALMRQYWIPGALSSELPGAGWRPHAAATAGRGPDRVSRQLWPDRRDPEQLPAPRRQSCSSAATKRKGCGASITAGSSTWTAPAWTCPTSRPRATSRPRSRRPRTAPRSAGAWCGCTWDRIRQRRHRLPDLEAEHAAGRGSTRWASSSANATTCRRWRATSTPAIRCSCTPGT